MHNYNYNYKSKNFANSNRKSMTKSEACLWKYVLNIIQFIIIGDWIRENAKCPPPNPRQRGK